MNTNLFKQVFDIFETCADVKNGSEEYHSVIAFDKNGDVRSLTDARTDERSERRLSLCLHLSSSFRELTSNFEQQAKGNLYYDSS